MAFGHEKLDVYRAAIEYVGWAYRRSWDNVGMRFTKRMGCIEQAGTTPIPTPTPRGNHDRQPPA